MKICKLKLKNLNSFREAVEIDFEKSPLDDASLVAITGPTGSGKTTLLDAICVALYGKTPRLSGTGSQNPNHLISHGEKEGFAEVLFMANGTRYLATWSVKRNSTPNVQLFYADDGKLISDKLSTRGKSLGSSQNTVSEEVESILGLDFDAFRRSVLLAQGEFAAFLKASNEERRTILEATAGISIYDVLKQALNDKVSEVETTNAEVYDKLNKIPEASREQLAAAETELNSLQTETDALGTESRHIQQAKERETERKADYEKLQSSEERQRELSDQQPEIDALESERALAEKAQRLLPEKQAFDTAQSEFKKSEEALRVATTEKTEAEARVKTDQVVYHEKAAASDAASTERDQKMPVYTAAKLDVEHAESKLAEAEKRDPSLASLSNQIEALENQLTDRKMEQTELQGQIDDAQRFLEDNPLPSDRQQRFNRVTGFLAELTSYKNQLQTEQTNRASTEENVSALKHEIEELSNTQQERLSKKAAAETALADTTRQLDKLLSTGTPEEWTARKQQAARAYPIMQEAEEMLENMENISEQANQLSDTVSILNAELAQIEEELREQTEVCRRTAETVEHCEAARESALLVNPINQLRQHLHTGEPCLVCGATGHPYADVVETESEELLQRTENALNHAKTEMQTAQDRMQALKMKQGQMQHDKKNTINQGSEIAAEAKELQAKAKSLDRQWEQISPDFNRAFGSIVEQDVRVSSKQDVKAFSSWIVQQIENADTAIAALRDAEQARTEASHAYEMVSQQLEACENDINRETSDLNDTETHLQNLNNTIDDLQADIAATEERFWESVPDTFHAVKPKEAVEQFDSRIKEAEAREDELRRAETDLQMLNVNIEADRGILQNLTDNRETLKNEKDEYLCQREAFLDAAREKTDGLETEDQINGALEKLETDLQSKENRSDAAEQQLQHSRNLLTQKQTAHEISETQFNASVEKLDAAHQVYFNKLEKEGFDAPEAHNEAFRAEAQLQELTAQIDAYKSEIQQLALEITELKTRFEETPYDPEALEQIESQLEEIEARLESKREKIGAQGEIIKGIKDALEKREALGEEIGAAQQELERWQRLHETIPANTLRDFALEIMFRQMGNLANEQLKYLTSERYQLKVETIGDLSVIDRWNANEERPVETLSGGESFLTSLALALALSELSRGRAQLNSLFLDEGFGTLDAETLDIAIAALEGLRMQGRNIFLISHIQELTRRLPVKINVRKRGDDGTYSSSIDIRG